MDNTNRILLTEIIAGAVTEEIVELLLDNLRDQLLARLLRAGYLADPAEVRGIVRQQGRSRQVEVWATYEQHTPEHREQLAQAYDDGALCESTHHAVSTDEVTPTDEHGEPLDGAGWAELLRQLVTNPHGTPGTTSIEGVLAGAWRRGWDTSREAREAGNATPPAPYRRTVRP